MKTFKNFFNKRDTKGITLIALVITIIVLLILAGVAINSIMSQDGAPDKAAQARLENRRGEAKDAAALVVKDLIQDYYNKKFVERASDATSAGEYVIEVLEEEEKTSGEYIISSEEDMLQVEDEDDVLATGAVQDDGVIVWDGTPRNLAATVNPWNNLANESDVVPDLFEYEITQQPQATGKVDGVTENAKVADNSGTIKVAEGETENLGKAKITGINVDKLASYYSESDYNKTYNYSDYGSSWEDLYYKYSNANVIGDYNYSSNSGTYYYNVPGSGRLDLSVDSSDIDRRYEDCYYVRASRLWDNLSYADLDAFVGETYYNNYYSIRSNYSSSVADMVYDSNMNEDENGVYWDNYPTNAGGGYIEFSDVHEVYRCTSDYYYNEDNGNAIRNAILSYIEEHPEQFKHQFVKVYCNYENDNWVTVNYEEDQSSYFTTNSFSPYFISEYSTTPACFNKLVIPHIYEEDGKKYEITKIDFSNNDEDVILAYVGDKISKLYIPNSVTSVDFGSPGRYGYTKDMYLDILLMPGGVNKVDKGLTAYLPTVPRVKKIVIGEGVTEVNASGISNYELTDVYLPKSLTNITGNWDSNVNVHYAGKKGQWKRVTGNKPNENKVTVRSRYSD